MAIISCRWPLFKLESIRFHACLHEEYNIVMHRGMRDENNGF
jgi:hypothetical protein